MAARTIRLFQENVNDAGTMSAKTDFTGQRKSKVGGRKPLGDLSNSVKPVDGKKVLNGSFNTVKPSISQTSKLLKSKNNNPAILNKEVVSAKGKDVEIDKKTGSKASKKSNTSGRKALSDISNSAKAHVHDVKNKNSLKTGSFTGKDLHPDEIAEERMLHDHEKCIKSQTQTLDIHHFFRTVGLEDDSDDDLNISFEPLAFREYESTLFKLEEVPEDFFDVPPLSAGHGSPVYCKSPKFSSCTMWDDDLAVDFKLIDSPRLYKN
ncbi:protein PATRONUS 2-like [Vicia villosa]|uniref:protein PATRONUS 2-like n=1 Tax=Vicia villosa TaxID=3911 RepID=UPI00273AB2C4|nr:protein PATRONUS 2-like [Vicia villosa]